MDDGRNNIPAAESTKLNHTNGPSGNGNSFRWGASPISSRNRSNSSTNLINFEGSVEESYFEKSRIRNVSKIDPRIAADVGSKGLASRIVKYKHHENESRLNRSMSAHNLYSKPGQFPLVTLKKTDLPYRATKQNVSMTRIAPPEKSMFYGNTLSSLLRSNSVVGLQKSDEDISRENRPIIHPPPNENDMAPTRSVLDVLKEISRKRINSDDLSTTETSKKNRIGNDLLDAGNNTSITNTSAVNMAIAANSFKRQRDVNSHSNVEVGSTFKNQEINKSPEQITKRVCSYNNDITSSLSSSAKRKPNEDKRLSQTMPAYVESYEKQKVKMQKRHDNNYSKDIRFNNLASSNDDVVTSAIPVQTPTNQFAYGAVPQRSKSEGTTVASIQSTSKPRLTLFNKNYDVSIEAASNDIGNEDNLDESSECAGIHFVKPKKMTSTGLKNPIIERTQKSKLALMLSGLRGELYQENHDVLDSPKKPVNVEVIDINQSKLTGENFSKTSPNAVAPGGTSTIQSFTQLKATSENTDSSATQFLAKANSKNASPLVGLKLTPQKAVPGTNLSQNSQQVNQTNTPVLGGFSNSNKTPVIDITNNSSSTKTSTVTTHTAIVKTSNSSNSTNQLPTFSFGTTVAESNASAATTTQAPFCLGVSIAPKPGNDNKNASTTTNVPIVAPVTSAPGNNAAPSSTFQFGSNASPELKLTPEAPSAFKFGPNPELKSSSTTPSAFKFGSNQSSELKSTSEMSSTFKFGNNPSSELKSKTTAVPSTTTSFTFGATSNPQANANSVTPNAQFSFNSSAGGNTAPAPSVNAFSFGSSSNNNNSVAFTVNTTNAASTHVSATSGVGVAPFNPNQASGPVFTSSAPSAPSNIFGSSNAAEQSLFSRSSSTNTTSAMGPETNKTMPVVFGGTSVTNNTLSSTSENKDNSAKDPPKSTGGFSFGTQATKSISNGTFAFGSSSSSNSGTSPPSSVAQSKPHFTFSSDNGVSDKKNPLHVFGGSTGGFSFGSASTVPKPSNVSSNKPFSFGSAPSNNTQSPVASNSSQPSSNLFALPAATAAFNFGASPSTNIQSNGPPNMTNNIFAASAGAGDRPIRRATRRLQK